MKRYQSRISQYYLSTKPQLQELEKSIESLIQIVCNRRVRKIPETKFNGGNLITGINTWVISL